MAERNASLWLCIGLVCFLWAGCKAQNVTIHGITWETIAVGGGVLIPAGVVPQQAKVAVALAVQYINSHAEPFLPDNVTITTDFRDHNYVVANAVRVFIDLYNDGHRLLLGNPLSDILLVTGQYGTVYEVAQVSGTAGADLLLDKHKYPFVTRLTATASNQIAALLGLIQDLAKRSAGGEIGWDKIAIIGTAESYSIQLCKTLIAEAKQAGIDVLAYQQILTIAGVSAFQFDVQVEVEQLKQSGARIFFALLFYGWVDVIVEAEKQGIVSPNHIWLTGDATVGLGSFNSPTTLQPIPEVVAASRGALGVIQYSPYAGPKFDLLSELWRNADPVQFPGAGPTTTPGTFAFIYFDMMFLTTQVLTKLYEMDMLERLDEIDAQTWCDLYRNTSLPDGASGDVKFTPTGERISAFTIVNFIPELLRWVPVAVVAPNGNVTIVQDPIFYDNTTIVPDLDIRPPFSYWSCHDKEKKRDRTGKTIKLRKPGEDDVDNIDSDYHCDQFIDCQNMSDETVDCDQNYLILFILFGILTGIMILVCILLLIFVVVFSWIFRRKRLRASSPFFLIIIVIASIFGFSSIYAWFGKPHPVACGFQPWLLGLGITAVITALFARCLRIWRIFAFPLKKTRISNYELLAFWAVTMFPAIVILVIWFIVSTPTATLEYHQDNDHYVCATGGFTGPPGGLVFFFIYVGYNGFIIFLSLILTIVTRNVPSLFNESKLIAVSIYNLIFLSAIVIPVYLVLLEFNPFIAWIIRTCAILYAFSATLFLQFFPKIIGMVFTDRCKDLDLNQINLQSNTSSSTSRDTALSNYG